MHFGHFGLHQIKDEKVNRVCMYLCIFNNNEIIYISQARFYRDEKRKKMCDLLKKRI